MKRLLFNLMICSLFFVVLGYGIAQNMLSTEVVAEGCKCCFMVECYYPGYRPGVDLPFVSKVVCSPAELGEYMEYMKNTVQYPLDWMEVPEWCAPVYFYMYSAP